MLDGGEENHEAARKRDVRGNAGPFGSQRLLDHLNHDVLSGAHEVFDGRGLGAPFFLLEQVLRKVFENILGVHEGIAFEPDVDEGRPHAGQDSTHATFVDVPGGGRMLRSLDEELSDLRILEEGYAGFFGRRSDDKFAPHG